MSGNEISVPISPGELIDKITILRIKLARMTDARKLTNVRIELEALLAAWRSHPYCRHDIAAEELALQTVNERLWVIEDDIRDKERAQAFDADFIRLARAVYFENDERAAIKRRINEKLGSSIIEEKSYRGYKAPR
jgi:predicted nucleic acid-binding Zn ribbon protein